ncbi:PREDICTED: probable germin-like protein subfamily 2 member 5 [Tarenaya hassleriana]|uniref:probable germin-like protein subfamily 2 member 5 n=1 Tax=Tarenaya hassleriana TaxID=28532 RepID=UPI00053C8AEA|nr:PREDICTED: probable germin-like protein subfamily 2 member 5 [Tarenaya hassleriana]
MASSARLFAAIFALALTSAIADSDMLQDVCVADLSSGVKVNGYTCTDPTKVTPDHFFSRGLATAGNTNTSPTGSVVTGANVEKIPGLNTLGVSMSRIDIAPGGINPPHIHPRATEIIFVLEGQLNVGFLTTAGKLVSKTLEKGDVYVFPKALIHFQHNVGKGPASAIAAFNSQLPGTQSIASTLFGSTPAIPDSVLSKAFKMSHKQVNKIKSGFQPKI